MISRRMHHIKVTPLSISHSHSNTNSINAQSMYDSIHVHTASILIIQAIYMHHSMEQKEITNQLYKFMVYKW